jgi:prepilin-type N-terminal cleavage/methylation domain-containing protein
MMKRQAGFTLVELMVTMVIFVLVIAAASQVFSGLLYQYKQQSKIAETNIESVVGLDILRRDIEHAGHGLPWELSGSTYFEADNAMTTPGWTTQNDESFNDGPPNNPARGTDPGGASNPPGAIRSGDNAGERGTDVLVIKAVNVSDDAAAYKWTYVNPGNTVKEWDIVQERMVTSDRVIVLTLSGTRSLVWVNPGSGLTFTTRYRADTSPDSLQDAVFAPDDDTITRIVYGVADPHPSDVTTPLRMPFNRADYYVRTPGALPTRCAVGTGSLYKAVLNHENGNLVESPILDCVADMQVVYRLDTDNDGVIDSDNNDISGLTAQEIRNELREVRVSVLAHEGQRDPQFTFNNFTGAATCATCVRVGESAALGRDFNLSGITDFLNYRWKVYRIVVQPINLR